MHLYYFIFLLSFYNISASQQPAISFSKYAPAAAWQTAKITFATSYCITLGTLSYDLQNRESLSLSHLYMFMYALLFSQMATISQLEFVSPVTAVKRFFSNIDALRNNCYWDRKTLTNAVAKIMDPQLVYVTPLAIQLGIFIDLQRSTPPLSVSSIMRPYCALNIFHGLLTAGKILSQPFFPDGFYNRQRFDIPDELYDAADNTKLIPVSRSIFLLLNKQATYNAQGWFKKSKRPFKKLEAYGLVDLLQKIKIPNVYTNNVIYLPQEIAQHIASFCPVYTTEKRVATLLRHIDVENDAFLIIKKEFLPKSPYKKIQKLLDDSEEHHNLYFLINKYNLLTKLLRQGYIRFNAKIPGTWVQDGNYTYVPPAWGPPFKKIKDFEPDKNTLEFYDRISCIKADR